ncbi:hypothetical protein HYT33_01580 [Candidatus Roizmanbacteria bacterium]|nr:hypothetical protein [Candidatus Roizmanbacteria bacterium]
MSSEFERFVKDKLDRTLQVPVKRDLEPHRNFLFATEQVLDDLLGFLQDPTRFPSKIINDLTTLFRDLAKNRHIYTFVNPAVSAMDYGVPETTKPLLVYLPVEFINQTNADPLFSLSEVVYISSVSRDFWKGEDVEDDLKTSNNAEVYTSEMLLTFQEMGGKDGVEGNLNILSNRYLRDIYKKYPRGIATEGVDWAEFIVEPYHPIIWGS